MENPNIYELTAEQFAVVKPLAADYVKFAKSQLDVFLKEYNESDGSMSSPAFDTILKVMKEGNDLHLRMCVG
jgi:hypothetical protein